MMDHFFLPGILSRSCRNRLQNWRCKYWLPVYSVFCAIAIAVSLFLFLFFFHYPNFDPSVVTPERIACNSSAVIEPNTNRLPWMSAMGIKDANFTGAVFVFRGTNCSILLDSRMTTRLEHNSWLGHPKFFLEGSHVSVRYFSGSHNFLFLKSLAAFQAYQDICKQFDDTGKFGQCVNNNRTISYLCLDGRAASLHLKGDVFCYMNRNSAQFDVNESDLYSLVFTANDWPLPKIEGVQYTYNISEIESMQEKEVHNISNIPGGNSFVSISIAPAFSSFEEVDICLLLHSSCNSEDSGIRDVRYTIQRRLDILICPSFVLVVCVVIFIVLVCVHFCNIRRQNDGK